MAPKRRLQEVADAAGVSFITAWRALNEPHRVRDKTREKVLTAAADVGYVVNAIARSLVTSRSGVVGLIVPTLEDSIFSATVQGLSDRLSQSGLEMLMGISHYDTNREEELMRAFVGRQIDALVLTGKAHSPAARKLLKNTGIAVVEIWDVPEEPLDLYVGFSNSDLSFQATKYLISRGYRDIAFVSPEARGRAQERQNGYVNAMETAGLGAAARTLWVAPTLAGGAEALVQLWQSDRRPDAIFFNGDTLAVGAHLHGATLGLRYPDDLALMGLHDSDISARVNPPLSTVRVPRYEIGKLAAEEIVQRLQTEGGGQSRQVSFEILQRGTT
ncbi:LacI family DNA-binding transcriptional regulator [Marinovum sp. 2_MG-2023]|uniref:LacI family DNA-binding transcriptional regulator n=1 Tax=unclassified Marinovum TaxID=2647166 RepID=UPI0026E279B5|nr:MULTISPECIES: LacI family DNA-binding transcriptional regulator [unclassified Marinovum]MDO6732267.1 LacI family DNA-binding transcriptional regulator [Marinovum sp. 2_MG-2023]MDO6781584.1 LacI family DNA-binding transcriptional regulator [Marinovum sp. 1_MG-2023]